MEVTSEAADENNEVDLTSQGCTADTNNMNETNDIQNEETEQSTFFNFINYLQRILLYSLLTRLHF